MSLIRQKNDILLQLCQHAQVCNICPAPASQPHPPNNADCMPPDRDRCAAENQSTEHPRQDDLQTPSLTSLPGSTRLGRVAGGLFSDHLKVPGHDVSPGSAEGTNSGVCPDLSDKNCIEAEEKEMTKENSYEPTEGKESGVIDHLPEEGPNENPTAPAGSATVATTATASEDASPTPKGFDGGVMFLQIIDGKICLLAPESSSGTSAPESSKDGQMTLFHLNTPSGLPFIVINNAAQNPTPSFVEQTSDRPVKSADKPRSSTSVKSVDESQLKTSTTSKKRKKKGKIASSGSNTHQHNRLEEKTIITPPNKKQKNKPNAYTRHIDPASFVNQFEIPATTDTTVYRDVEEDKGIDTGGHNTSRATSTRTAQSSDRTLGLRDQTNVMPNTSGSTAEFHRKQAERSLSRHDVYRANGYTSTLHEESGPAGKLAIGPEVYTTTNASLYGRNRFVSDSPRRSSQNTDDGGWELCDATEHNVSSKARSPQNVQSHALPGPRNTGPNTSGYDPDFQNFLTSCFQSLDNGKDNSTGSVAGAESRGSTKHGLLVLTSKELNCLMSGGAKAASQSTTASRLDLPSVDTACLLNLMGGEFAGHRHQDSAGQSRLQSSSVHLFSGLKNFILDSENCLTTNEIRSTPASQGQGYCLLPLLFSGGQQASASVFPAADIVAQGAAAGGRQDSPELTQTVGEDGEATCMSLLSRGEHSRLVESLIHSLAQSSAAAASDRDCG